MSMKNQFENKQTNDEIVSPVNKDDLLKLYSRLDERDMYNFFALSIWLCSLVFT